MEHHMKPSYSHWEVVDIVIDSDSGEQGSDPHMDMEAHWGKGSGKNHSLSWKPY